MTEARPLDLAAPGSDLDDGIYLVKHGRITVPVKYRRGTGDIAVVIFHGAVDQKKRRIPWFQASFPGLENCHQFAIADPTLSLDPALEASWYIGGAGIPLQAELPALLQALFSLAGIRRRIYLGGSSGGFAALYYALVDQGSLCIAVNPQTNLNLYSTRVTSNYLRLAWPGAKSLDEIASQAVIDLPAAYARGFRNMVIYLQSAGDSRHFGIQMPPFLQAAVKKPENFILNCGYWGVSGHSNSIPSRDYYPWVKAVVAAPWFDRQAILDTYHALTAKAVPATRTPSSSGKVAAQGDSHLADLLRDYHLRQPTED